MTDILEQPAAGASGLRSPGSDRLRPVLVLALVALVSGWVLLSLPIGLGLPVEPFVLGTLYLGMVLPALVLTARESGRPGVRALLRSVVTLPRPWWWLLVAATAIPAVSLLLAAPLDGLVAVDRSVASGAAVQFGSGLLLVNLLEEMFWMRSVQHRLMARWGLAPGSLVTAGLFAGIHLPLAFAGGLEPRTVLTAVAVLIGTAVLLRLAFGALYLLSGGGVLVIGLMHATFNVTGEFVAPAYDTIRLAAVAVVAVALLLVLRIRSTHPTTQEL